MARTSSTFRRTHFSPTFGHGRSVKGPARGGRFFGLALSDPGELKMKTILWVLGALSVLALGGCAGNRVIAPADRAATPQIVMEEFKVSAMDPGIELYRRNKHRAHVSTYA